MSLIIQPALSSKITAVFLQAESNESLISNKCRNKYFQINFNKNKNIDLISSQNVVMTCIYYIHFSY